MITCKNKIKYRKASETDFNDLKRLFIITSAQGNGIARKPNEISDEYIKKILNDSIKNGLIIVAENKEKIIGTVKAVNPEPACFAHILTDLTILVHPECQGQGIGKNLFEEFFAEIKNNLPHIKRVELYVRESNTYAIKLYESLGFQKEGFLRKRIKNSSGIAETDIMMGWVDENQFD